MGRPSRAEPRRWDVPLRVPRPTSCVAVAVPGKRGLSGGKPARPRPAQPLPLPPRPGSEAGRRGRAGRRAEGLQEQERVRPLRIQSVHEKPLHESGRRTWGAVRRTSPAPSRSVAGVACGSPTPIRSTPWTMRRPLPDSPQVPAPSATKLSPRPCLWAGALPHAFSGARAAGHQH